MRNHFEFGASELRAKAWLRNTHFYVAGNRRPVKRERSKKISPLLFYLEGFDTLFFNANYMEFKVQFESRI